MVVGGVIRRNGQIYLKIDLVFDRTAVLQREVDTFGSDEGILGKKE